MVTRTAPGLTVNALMQRRWRERQKHPVRYVCRIEYERDGLLRALLNTGRLPQADIWRRDLVERQLSLLIAEWVEVSK